MSSRPLAGWILASTNPGKLAEFRELFAGTSIELEALESGSRRVPEETGRTFVENALIKARHAAGLTGRRAIADDSGLSVEALGGAPGVHSARYAGPAASDRDNIDRLLRELSGLPPAERRASFFCVIVALERPDDPAPVIATGRWNGVIAAQPRGTNGFGYDPVFLDPGLGRTAAELAPAEKNRVSHRARACAELRRLLGG
jgi:XTP/dITP diphosphohydrolase